MALDARNLRKWFAGGAIAMAALVLAFWLVSRLRDYQLVQRVKKAPGALGINVEKTAQGYTFSKSEGGRTLFTVRAAKAVEYKLGGRAELEGVNIVIYGRQANRFDQIYGEKFSYDPGSGEVRTGGEVHIDLESNAEGPVRPDQAPPKELKNPIHLKTSGLVFQRDTGLAQTAELIDFRVPQASGTARGAIYDSRRNTLTLQSAIRVRTTGPDPATITATHGWITGERPREAVLDNVKVERASGSFQADKLTIYLRDENTIDRMAAAGNVKVRAEGESPLEARAPQAAFEMGEKSLTSATLSGGVSLESGGRSPISGAARRVVVDFGPANAVRKVRALEHVVFTQTQPGDRKSGPQTTEIAAGGVELQIAGHRVASGTTSGAARITVRQAATGDTVITAGRFDVQFDRNNRLKSLHGQPDARIVSRAPGQPERVTTSRELTIAFAATGGISAITQEGDFRYSEAQRTATAERARYSLADNLLVLTGFPRVSEESLSATANTIRVNRATGDMSAEGEVKTTYNQPGQRAGAMFSAGDPIHATAPAMSATRAGRARYAGGARLWQGANIVQGPVIEFDRERRTVAAQGTTAQPVSTVFVQADKNGKLAPVNVTGRRLTYSDAERKARFEGGVVLQGADLTVTAVRVEVFLKARAGVAGGSPPAKPVSEASQLERAVAEGDIVIQEQERRATGDRLVYTAADGKFVLTGVEGRSPSIFDAERGTITGDSLTFYSRDDRVVVGSKDSSRTVTQTRVKP